MPLLASRVSSVRVSRLSSERGSILILTALSMVVLLGMVALAIDGSFQFTERNRMSAAADAGAKSAALEYRRNNSASQSDLEAFANREATAHNFDPGVTTTVTVHRPPSSGAFTSNPYYVEVIVSRPTATFFARILDPIFASLTPAARAVAGTSSGPNCLVALDQSGNPSLFIGQTVNLQSPGCNITSNGTMQVGPGSGGGSGVINASSVGVQGDCAPDVRCGTFQENVGAPFEDPLAAIPEPTNPYSAPPAAVHITSSGSLDAGWYSSITIDNFATVTFGPGLYWISGPIIVRNNVVITGSNLMFFFAGSAATGPCGLAATAGCITVGNSPNITLTARSGIGYPYEGILFFQSRSNALNADFANAGTYTLSGAMYFPAANLSLGNAGGSNDCSLIVANRVSLGSGGGGSMAFSNTCALFGGSPLLTVSLAE